MITARFLLPLSVLLAGTSASAAPVTIDATPDPLPRYDWHSRTVPPAPLPADVRVNTLGFTPDASKIATVLGDNRAFTIRRLDDGSVVFSGRTSGAMLTKDTDTGGELLSFADFSSLKTPGTYVLEVEGGRRPATFEIGEHVWNEAFRVTTRGLYLWRCGVAVDAVINGVPYHHDACHLNDGFLDFVGGKPGERTPSTGGWHDAGDYNKYVVNAGVTAGLLWKAWEEFRPGIEKVSLGLPESGKGLPDLLAELKFEYDWLFTMQEPDGRVRHKVSAQNFGYWGPPDKDPSARFFSPWSSTATADYTALMALGARHFREFDAAYADRCLAAAEKAWTFLQQNPEDHPADLSAFHTGTYRVEDTTHRLWAAAELWETTGRADCLADFEKRTTAFSFKVQGPDWGDVRDLALGTYVKSKRAGRDSARVTDLLRDLHNVASVIVDNARHNAHARPLGDTAPTYFWGCNGSVAAQTYLLNLAYTFDPLPEYPKTAADALGYLFGRNYHGRSYVTGLGFMPPTQTHDRRGLPQLPGYLVGGPTPTAKHWYDNWEDPSRNEIAINWNGSLIYALAGFLRP